MDNRPHFQQGGYMPYQQHQSYTHETNQQHLSYPQQPYQPNLQHQQVYLQTNQAQLPPGWIQTWDPSSGRYYYANLSTGESRWDPPSVILPPPPPPPPSPLPQFVPVNVLSQTQATATAPEQPSNECVVSQACKAIQNPQDGEDEYSELSAGIIADLCIIQRQQNSDSYYTPLDVIKMQPNAAHQPLRNENIQNEVDKLLTDLKSFE